MWERSGDDTQELIYFSQFGTAAARWVIKGSVYGEWAEISADSVDARPPDIGVWMVNDGNGDFYQTLTVTCTQCEVTPAPTPDPTETPTNYPTSLTPTASPTPIPSIYCLVLNVTDLTNGYYNGYFEMDVLPYNGRFKWTDKTTGETLHWADSAMFEHEGAVENIWMLGFAVDEGEEDSHFLIFKGDIGDIYPPIEIIEHWMEYTFNEFTNQTSDVLINCEETLIPTTTPTSYPTEPLCTELFVDTCCDPVYTDIGGSYQASSHRGGKNMYTNAENGYSIYYTESDDGFWSIRSEDEELIWVESGQNNGAYPPWNSLWNLENHVLTDIEVMVNINCSESFSPSTFPTTVPTAQPTVDPTSLAPSPMPTLDPTFDPTQAPTMAPTESCVALEIVERDGEIVKYDGTYARTTETKNGKTQWVNYETGAYVYWIDRGIWANTWIIKAGDSDFVMVVDDPRALHPPPDQEWSALGDGLLQGDQYLNFQIVCTTQPPAPAPTVSPTLAPTCGGNAIYIEDPCDANITGGTYAGYYNYEYTHDGKKAYVRLDGMYEVLYIAENLFGELWMIRPHDGELCEHYWVIDGYSEQESPPADAFWSAYGCECGFGFKYKCNFRITCMHTAAPIPTEDPTVMLTDAPVDTPVPSPDPTSDPTPAPTSNPTMTPTNEITPNPTLNPITPSPTQAPVPYECTPIDLQPCVNITNRIVSFYERSENLHQMTSNYYETKLYSEQKGYSFVADKDMVMYEAGMAFIDMGSYQSITVRVFDSTGTLMYDSQSLSGRGETNSFGTPRGDFYTFKNINVQLIEGQQYTVVFVIHCPTTMTSTAQYPLCSPHYELFRVNDFGSEIINVYAYGEDYDSPTESDLYAPFVRICFANGLLEE